MNVDCSKVNYEEVQIDSQIKSVCSCKYKLIPITVVIRDDIQNNVQERWGSKIVDN